MLLSAPFCLRIERVQRYSTLAAPPFDVCVLVLFIAGIYALACMVALTLCRCGGRRHRAGASLERLRARRQRAAMP